MYMYIFIYIYLRPNIAPQKVINDFGCEKFDNQIRLFLACLYCKK